MPYPSGPKAPGEWREGFFDSADGLRLFEASRVVPSAKGAVVVVHGYADQCLRYRHVMDALGAGGFSSYAFDYRGHGQAAGRRGYVGSFSEYLGDLASYLSRVRAGIGKLPLFILGHSHGALVSGTYLLSPEGAAGVAGAIFSSPYYRLKIDPSWFQLFQAKVVGKIIPFLPVKNPLKEEMLTHDPAFLAASKEDALRHHVVTPKWFTESNAAQASLLANAGAFKLPLLVMVGADDPVAHPDGGRQFFDAAGSTDKKFVSYAGMLHEIFNEVEREKPIAETIGWLEAHVSAKVAA
jgi:alpha-beta hydrolase superfamily lysophospholipase